MMQDGKEQLHKGGSLSALPNLPQLRTAINEDSNEDESFRHPHLPVSVPLSRSKK